MSNFAGDWQYARQSAKGDAVVEDRTTITITDDEGGHPHTVKIPPLELSVVGEKTGSSIFFKMGETHRGRLVLLSDATPALLTGSISKGDYSDQPKHVQDQDIDVFIAVKIC